MIFDPFALYNVQKHYLARLNILSIWKLKHIKFACMDVDVPSASNKHYAKPDQMVALEISGDDDADDDQGMMIKKKKKEGGGGEGVVSW